MTEFGGVQRDDTVIGRMKQQHGLISRTQALDAGLTKRQIEHRVASGHWVREARGVYRHAAVAASGLTRLRAAWMAHGGLASHRSAAALHHFDGYRLNTVELTVAPGRNRAIKGVRFYQSTQLNLAKPVVRDDIEVTGPARTVLDLAAVVSSKRLDRTVDAVLRSGQLRLSDLWGVLASHACRGRPGCAALKASLEERFGDEPVPLSAWSRMVAELLTDAGLDYPALEHRIHDARGDFVAQVDLAYPAQWVAIELDSARWHDNRESFVEDRRRRNEITLAGWNVLNFTWDDYASRSERLRATVIGALDGGGQAAPGRTSSS
ncbi:MAG: type IV toxin-antitoxin system AbiEi family antitoxin domain-containing protein [Acidimicrobiaceae bacterium]|nr:type IV toxin-antitoxin system AbiEi family antitoxin domain-containing protein [Acidimicrobiaceae bacterium]MYH78224.1 type IV toxin-antitoxin system AbiEi family antitoxin domain-containing protein [Acidimicrobiaceae bacterium]MYK75705.1 type IV toxin-antitoxin system AbiEi family antitoxin domain-containing protein [Acidimicrobiaceae bacterium]